MPKKEDAAFFSSVNAALLEKSSLLPSVIIWIVILSVTWFIVWANFAQIDELTRGEGKVIPSSQTQIVQNLEGGIVSEIYVKEGEEVKKGQQLLKIQDVNFASSLRERKISIHELSAKRIRLEAEATGKEFTVDEVIKEAIPERFIEQERSLYVSNQEQLLNSLEILQLQLQQRQNELDEVKTTRSKLQQSYRLLLQEITLTEPLARKGIVSQIEFLKLKRQVSDIKGEINVIEITIPKINASIEEAKSKMTDMRLKFQNSAKQELNEVTAEISRIQESQDVFQDRVARTVVKSPVNGTIQKILVNTVGGVVKPGMELIEIIPSDDTLIIEAKIKPSDVAFLYPGQKAKVKFTAYDFLIYGGLEGEVIHISADTMRDQNEHNYYLVRIRTKKNYLGPKDKSLKIKVGMIANIDIITGKKSIIDYILKPILRAKENALSER